MSAARWVPTPEESAAMDAAAAEAVKRILPLTDEQMALHRSIFGPIFARQLRLQQERERQEGSAA